MKCTHYDVAAVRVIEMDATGVSYTCPECHNCAVDYDELEKLYKRIDELEAALRLLIEQGHAECGERER